MGLGTITSVRIGLTGGNTEKMIRYGGQITAYMETPDG